MSCPKQSRSSDWSGFHQRNQLAVIWMNGSCQGAARALAIKLHFTEVHDKLTKSWCTPYLARLHTSTSSTLTTVNGADEKGYEKLPPLDEVEAAHLCQPTAIGWKKMVAHPSKSCRATSALAGHAYTSAGQAASAFHTTAVQVFPAKLLHSMDESGPNPAAFRELRSATDLALCAIKARPSAGQWQV